MRLKKLTAHGRPDGGGARHVCAGEPAAAAHGHSRHQAGAFQYFYALHHGDGLGPGWAFGLFFTRVTLGCVITGQSSAFLYSFAGGLCAYALMLLLRRKLKGSTLWVKSVLCAMAHNAGQLAAAAAIAKTGAVWSYLPVLIPAAILAGTLTGLCTQLVLHRLAKAGVLPEETSPKKQEEEANG